LSNESLEGGRENVLFCIFSDEEQLEQELIYKGNIKVEKRKYNKSAN
jgi:hypothetical protein